jgi:hypothetical protein
MKTHQMVSNMAWGFQNWQYLPTYIFALFFMVRFGARDMAFSKGGRKSKE